MGGLTMTLKDMLSQEAVTCTLQAKNKEEALEKLTKLLAKNGCVSDRQLVLAELKNREERASTAISGGVALPHCSSSGVTKPCMAFAICQEGLDFGAVGGELTRIFALALSPETKGSEYLNTVVALIDKLRIRSIREKILACRTDGELYDRLMCYNNTKVDIKAITD